MPRLYSFGSDRLSDELQFLPSVSVGLIMNYTLRLSKCHIDWWIKLYLIINDKEVINCKLGTLSAEIGRCIGLGSFTEGESNHLYNIYIYIYIYILIAEN